jgi:hypothetical protein
MGKEVETSCLSSLSMAREIASTLKGWIEAGKFLLSRPVELLPGVGSGVSTSMLKDRPIEKQPSPKMSIPYKPSDP